MRSGTLTAGGKPTTTFACLHLGAIFERGRCLVLADRTVGSSYYQAAGRAAKLCKRWSLAGSEHAGLGMCPARTTNPPFISSARPGEGQYGRVEGGGREVQKWSTVSASRGFTRGPLEEVLQMLSLLNFIPDTSNQKLDGAFIFGL